VVFKLEAGGDYGWPFCYYDWRRRQNVMQPEYTAATARRWDAANQHRVRLWRSRDIGRRTG